VILIAQHGVIIDELLKQNIFACQTFYIS